MEAGEDLDVDQLMQRVRERVIAREQASTARAGTAGGAQAPSPVRGDVATLHAGYDIQRIAEFSSHRTILGPFILGTKRLLRRLLKPVLERQVAYNAANTRVISHLVERVEVVVRQQERLRARIEEVQGLDQFAPRLSEQGQALTTLEARLHEEKAAREALETLVRAERAARQTIEAHRLEDLRAAREVWRMLGDRLARTERKLRRVLLHLTGAVEGVMCPGPVLSSPSLPDPGVLEPAFDYAGFEDRFRGDEKEIKDRQRKYLAVFEGQRDVIDIGCGRGEFLELCREAGVGARGVELDLDMVLLCRDKGLDVVQGDAFSYLAALPEESLGGVFAAQVIEHLQPSATIELVKLCHRKLRVGGRAVFETPNPGCLGIFARGFYVDLTHIRPIHADALKFVFESVGFDDVSIEFSAPMEASARVPSLPADGVEAIREFNRGIEQLNELIFGFQDYAVVGTKTRRIPREAS